MADGWFKFTLADFEANNQTLHNSVESCIKTKRNRLYYSCLSRHILFELASDLIVRGIINKQGSQIPVSTLSERTYCDNDTNKQRGLKQRKEVATPGHKLEPS